jgi:hypothetical protein
MDKSIKDMNRSELRAACKSAGIQYSKLTTGGMRDELTRIAAPVAPVAPVKVDKAATAGLKIEKDRDEQNGIKRPSVGGTCRAAWDAFDHIGIKTATAQSARELAEAHGWNKNNTSIEFYQWRRFHGVTGRVKTAK